MMTQLDVVILCAKVLLIKTPPYCRRLNEIYCGRKKLDTHKLLLPLRNCKNYLAPLVNILAKKETDNGKGPNDITVAGRLPDLMRSWNELQAVGPTSGYLPQTHGLTWVIV